MRSDYLIKDAGLKFHMKVFIKFFSVGVAATFVQYFLLIVIVETTVTPPYIASSFSYGVSAILNYAANYYFSFQSKVSHRSAGAKFVTVVITGLLLNGFILFIVNEKLAVNYLLSQIISSIIVTGLNFILLKRWVYK